MRVIPKGELLVGFTADGVPITLTARQRSQHLIAVGGTGSGKTTFFEHAIRQDIRARRGVCLIDPNRDLYERTLRYLCYLYRIGFPLPEVILLNPSDGDWVTPFNPFLMGPGDIGVQVDRRVEATLRAWGQETGDSTPRLAKWLKIIFHVLIECELTMAEAGYLVDQKAVHIRAYLIRGLSDPFIRTKLEQLAHYKLSDFLSQVESVESRLMRFLCSGVMRRTMGVGTNVLDFASIMDRGTIALCNFGLSSYVSAEQQRLLGTLPITECFEAAMRRPTGSRPFYLYIDEAQLFVVPEIGQALDQCRKKGLHLNLGFQHLSQFKAEDLKLYKSVKNNARNKIVFAIPDREDATELADDIFGGLAEPEIKLIRRRLNHLIVDTRETSSTRATGTSRTTGFSRTVGRSKGYTTGESEGVARSASASQNHSASLGHSVAEGEAWEEAHGQAWADSAAETSGSADSSTAFYSLESSRHSHTLGSSSSFATARSQASSVSNSHSTSKTVSRSESQQSGITFGTGLSHTNERSQSESLSESVGEGTTSQAGGTHTQSVTNQPGTRHIPFLEEDPEHWTLEERRWRAAELLMRQPTGHCFVGIGSTKVASVTVPQPKKVYISDAHLLRFSRQLHERNSLPRDQAEQIIKDRQARLLAEAQPGTPPTGKAKGWKKPVESNPFDDILREQQKP